MNIQNKSYIKLLFIFIYVFLIYALILTVNSPAKGYEASIYLSTPWQTWFILVLTYVIGITFITLAIFKPFYNKGILFYIGLLIPILTYIISLSLYIIRGYYLWCISGDPGQHIRFIIQIIETGVIPQSGLDIYPLTHILVSQIQLTSNLNLLLLSKIIPLISCILFILYIFILVYSFTNNNVSSIIAILICCGFIYGWYLNFTPNAFSNFYAPIVIYIIFNSLKKLNGSWIILLIIELIVSPLYHPVFSLFIIILLSSYIFPITIIEWKKRKGNFTQLLSYININIKTHLILPLLIYLIWSIFWYSLYHQWKVTINSIYNSIFYDTHSSQLNKITSDISMAQDYGYNVLEMFIKQYGILLIICIMSTLLFPYLFRRYYYDKKIFYLFSLYSPMSILLILIPILLLFNLSFGPTRLFIYILIIGTILVSYFISNIIMSEFFTNIKNHFFIKKVFILLLLSCFFFLGIAYLYPSPYNLTSNQQIAISENEGMSFVFSFRDPNTPLLSITSYPQNYANFLLNSKDNSDQQLPYRPNRVPWHFGYNLFSSIKSLYNSQMNLIITKRDKLIYTDYFPQMAQYRFFNSDFKVLTFDTGLNLLYSNGEFDYWLIK